MSNTGIIYANTTASALTNKLINQDKQLRLLDSKNGADALKVLVECGFGDGVTVQNSFDFEVLCEQEEANLYRFIMQNCPCEYSQKVLTAFYDYHNIKSALKCKYGKNVDWSKLCFRFTDMNADELKERIFQDSYRELSENQQMLCKKIDDLHVMGQLTPSKIDIESDKLMYGEIFNMLKKANQPTLMEYYKTKVDLTNINTVARAKKYNLSEAISKSMILPCGDIDEKTLIDFLEGKGENLMHYAAGSDYAETAKLVLDSAESNQVKFEVGVENALMNVFKSIKFDPEKKLNPFFAYVVARRAVIRNVRLIMVCINNELDKAEIRERLVETYDR